jgi:uncharacterized membrane protein YhdT
MGDKKKDSSLNCSDYQIKTKVKQTTWSMQDTKLVDISWIKTEYLKGNINGFEKEQEYYRLA